MTMSFLFCAAITAISALISLGFSVVTLRDATGPARTLAFYACSRSVAFAVIALGAFAVRSIHWLEAAATGMIILQALDAAIGLHTNDKRKTFGPAGTAVANAVALVWLTAV